MGNLLFSPSGRIGPGQFMSGVKLLIIIGFVLSLLPALSPVLGIVGIIGIVLYWCWIVLWVKRYHDGGKSGWMCLIPIIVFLIVGGIIGYIISEKFADPEIAAKLVEATDAQDFGAIFSLSLGGGMTKTGIVVTAVVTSVISFVIALIFNGMIKQDMHDNQFGPHGSTGDTFS